LAQSLALAGFALPSGKLSPAERLIGRYERMRPNFEQEIMRSI
jgi:hypothetical protein